MGNFLKNYENKTFEMARKNFAEHVLKKEADHLYLVRNPENGFFWFRIAFLPGIVLLYGDVGELVLSCPSARETQGWLAGAHKSHGYMLSKVPHEFRRDEFNEDYAREIVEEYLEEGDLNVNDAENILEQMDNYNWDPAQWPWAWQEHSQVDETPDATVMDASTVHQIVAIETFFNLLNKMEEGTGNTPAATTA